MTRDEFKTFVCTAISSSYTGDDRVINVVAETITEQWKKDVNEAIERGQEAVRDVEFWNSIRND